MLQMKGEIKKMFGIPKPVKQEWSSCQLDFVKEFILHNESDVAKLPACCVGSKATVTETNNRYVCCKDGKWKLESIAMSEGTGEGTGTGGAQKTIVNIAPDNSCSMSFSDVRDLVMKGQASFKLMKYGTMGAPIQASWTSDMNINGVIQSTIQAHIIVVTETALKAALLIWGEKSGISVTSKNISFS